MAANQRYRDYVADRLRRGRYGLVSAGADAFEAARFKRPEPHQYVCTTWFERDRAKVRLETPHGRVLFDLWDDAVYQAIEDGFLKPPRTPRPSGRDWQPCAVQYALDMGLIILP